MTDLTTCAFLQSTCSALPLTLSSTSSLNRSACTKVSYSRIKSALSKKIANLSPSHFQHLLILDLRQICGWIYARIFSVLEEIRHVTSLRPFYRHMILIFSMKLSYSFFTLPSSGLFNYCKPPISAERPISIVDPLDVIIFIQTKLIFCNTLTRNKCCSRLKRFFQNRKSIIFNLINVRRD